MQIFILLINLPGLRKGHLQETSAHKTSLSKGKSKSYAILVSHGKGEQTDSKPVSDGKHV